MSRLSVVVATVSLVAGTAAFGQRVGADTLYVVQDPPTVTVSAILECAGADASAKETCSSSSTVTSLQPGDYDGVTDSRSVYRINVDVDTPGVLDSIEKVAVCVYDFSEIGSSIADIDTACGYADTDNTTRVAAPSMAGIEDHVFSMTWSNTPNDTTDTPAFTIDEDDALKHNNRGSSDDFANDGTSMTVSFQFSLSYVLAKAADWRVRTVVVDQAPTDPSSASPDKQRTEVLGITGCAGNECTNLGASAATNTDHSMLYYGGITTNRGTDTTVNYGTLTAGATSAAQTSLTTGAYVANNTSDFTVQGTDFTYTDGSSNTYTLSLKESGAASLDEVELDCTREADSADTKVAPDGSEHSADVRVGTSGATDLVTGEAATIDGGSEAAGTAAEHQCALTYGGGADVGNQTYTNTVTITIVDAP